MDRNEIVSALNAEIASLTTVRDLLMNGTGTAPVRRGRKPGRKPGLSIAATASPVAKRRSNMSPEGRKSLSDAMRARWAAKRDTVKTPKKAAKTAAKR
jgi:hypothetical protein